MLWKRLEDRWDSLSPVGGREPAIGMSSFYLLPGWPHRKEVCECAPLHRCCLSCRCAAWMFSFRRREFMTWPYLQSRSIRFRFGGGGGGGGWCLDLVCRHNAEKFDTSFCSELWPSVKCAICTEVALFSVFHLLHNTHTQWNVIVWEQSTRSLLDSLDVWSGLWLFAQNLVILLLTFHSQPGVRGGVSNFKDYPFVSLCGYTITNCYIWETFFLWLLL